MYKKFFDGSVDTEGKKKEEKRVGE